MRAATGCTSGCSRAFSTAAFEHFFAATIDTVEQLWRKACNGRDVDDSALYRYLLT